MSRMLLSSFFSNFRRFKMRYANIALYLVCAVVAGFVALTGAQMFEAIPYLPYDIVENITDPLRAQMMNEGVWQTMAYWGPKIEFALNFSILVIPASLGVAVLLFSEKKLFTRQADKHLHTALPLGILVAICVALTGVSQNQQFAFVFGILAIMTLYTTVYQVLGAHKPKKEVQPA